MKKIYHKARKKVIEKKKHISVFVVVLGLIIAGAVFYFKDKKTEALAAPGDPIWVQTIIGTDSLLGVRGYQLQVDSTGLYANNVQRTALEKRSKINGSLIWSASAATKNSVALESTGVYTTNGINLEKHDLSSGALIWSAPLSWPGWASVGSESSYGEIFSMEADSTGVYIATYDLWTVSPPDTFSWMVEKRSIANGSLVWRQRINLMPGSYGEVPYSVAIDATGVYFGGYVVTSSSTSQFRVEKRDKNTGALIWLHNAPVSSGDAWALTIDSTGLYAAGRNVGETGYIEKLNLSTGALIWQQFMSLPVHGMAVYSSGVYTIGSYLGGGSEVRIEKRDANTGALLWYRQVINGTNLALDIVVDSTGVYSYRYQSYFGYNYIYEKLEDSATCNFNGFCDAGENSTNCASDCAQDCLLPWGGSIPHGSSTGPTVYTVGSVPCGSSCPAPTSRTCTNGTLSGTGSFNSCSISACLSCNNPWGGTTPNAGTATAYQNSAPACGSSCVSQVRTCNNGTWSFPFTYSFGSCTVQPCSSCILPWGGSINHNQSVNAYSTSAVACGLTCPAPTTRTCFDGTLSGSGNFSTCAVSPCSDCLLPWGGSITNGSSINAYSTSSVACGLTCPAPTSRTCNNGTLSGSGNFGSCSVAACSDCLLPWGGSITNGSSINAYSTSSVACGLTCPAPTSRTCNNGTLSGTGNFSTCAVSPCSDCLLPWGGSITNGSGVNAYSASSVTCGTCPAPVWRVCSNGTLLGSGSFSSCSELPCTNCTTPWGTTVLNGNSVQAYSTSSVTCGSTCPAPTTRTCTNGTLSGTGGFSSCSVQACSGCILPWGGSINHGQSVQAYSTSSVACGLTCPAPVTRTCSNGTLSGTGDFSTCSPVTCLNCNLPWGGSINHGASVNAYSTSSVACGSTCPASTVRTCTNGTLSGTGSFSSCTPTACLGCTLPWGGTIAHGASRQAYQTSSVACEQTCAAPETRTCYDGILSGSYTNQSCSTLACLGCNLPWGGSIPHRASVPAYSIPLVVCGQNCPLPQMRTCFDGTLDGSGNFETCAVDTCPVCGPAEDTPTYLAPTTGLCSVGNPSGVLDAGDQWMWTCTASTTITCYADMADPPARWSSWSDSAFFLTPPSYYPIVDIKAAPEKPSVGQNTTLINRSTCFDGRTQAPCEAQRWTFESANNPQPNPAMSFSATSTVVFRSAGTGYVYLMPTSVGGVCAATGQWICPTTTPGIEFTDTNYGFGLGTGGNRRTITKIYIPLPNWIEIKPF